MRCLVCSGMDRAAGELFSVAETVPAARPNASPPFSASLFCFLYADRRSSASVSFRRPRQSLAVLEPHCRTWWAATCFGATHKTCREYSRDPSQCARFVALEQLLLEAHIRSRRGPVRLECFQCAFASRVSRLYLFSPSAFPRFHISTNGARPKYFRPSSAFRKTPGSESKPSRVSSHPKIQRRRPGSWPNGLAHLERGQTLHHRIHKRRRRPLRLR